MTATVTFSLGDPEHRTEVVRALVGIAADIVREEVTGGTLRISVHRSYVQAYDELLGRIESFPAAVAYEIEADR